MDKFQLLQDQVDKLQKQVDDLYSDAGFPNQVERSLVSRGFIRNYQSLVFNNASGDEFKLLLTEHNNEKTALGGDLITKYLQYTVNPSNDTFTSLNHGLSDTQQVIPYSSGSAVPSPLAVGVIYYVRDATTDTFKLAATSGGAAINITNVGTGIQYLQIV